jgi:hypothetical protein
MRSVAKWGVIIGVASYIVSLAIYYINYLIDGAAAPDPAHPTAVALGCLQLLVIAFAFSAAGFFAGRDSRVAGYGALAGMLTCAVYGVLRTLIPLAPQASSGAAGLTAGQQLAISIISDALILGIAALIGWLGGRPGAARGKAQAARANAASDGRAG